MMVGKPFVVLLDPILSTHHHTWLGSVVQIRILLFSEILVREELDPFQCVREVILGALAAEVIRGVFVLFAEAQVAHEARGRVAQVHRDGQGGRAGLFLEGAVHLGEGTVDAYAFGGQGEGDDGVREVDPCFGQADFFDRVVCRRAQVQECVVGQADVFTRDHYQPASDVEGRFARGEHPSQVVERGRGGGPADGFVKGGDGVVWATGLDMEGGEKGGNGRLTVLVASAVVD